MKINYLTQKEIEALDVAAALRCIGQNMDIFNTMREEITDILMTKNKHELEVMTLSNKIKDIEIQMKVLKEINNNLKIIVNKS